MKILSAAHRAEVKPLLSTYGLKPSGPGMYDDGKGSLGLVITGEGTDKAMVALSLAAGHWRAVYGPIAQVINLGFAGALSDAVSLGQVVRVDAVYRETSPDSYHPLSFQGSPATAWAPDLITCHSRVEGGPRREALRQFADLVDREAWGAGYVARKLGAHFQVLKVVSDLAEAEDQCAGVRELAPELSKSLCRELSGILGDENSRPTKGHLVLPDGFHASHSQRQRLEALMKGLARKWAVPIDAVLDRALEPRGIASIRQNENQPKRRTTKLLEALGDCLSPQTSTLRRALEKATEPVTRAGARVSFAPSYDRTEISLTQEIRSEADLEALRKALGRWDYGGTRALLEGEDPGVS